MLAPEFVCGRMLSNECVATYEAEDSASRSGGYTWYNSDGVDGYFDYNKATGGYIEWNTPFCISGYYSIRFAYSLRSGNRPMKVSLNGETIAESLDFPETGGWAVWGKTAKVWTDLNLTSVIVLETIGFDGPYLDYMEIDIYRITDAPTHAPTPAPSSTPTSAPTVSMAPTGVPSYMPTAIPTMLVSNSTAVIGTTEEYEKCFIYPYHVYVFFVSQGMGFTIGHVLRRVVKGRKRKKLAMHLGFGIFNFVGYIFCWFVIGLEHFDGEWVENSPCWPFWGIYLSTSFFGARLSKFPEPLFNYVVYVIFYCAMFYVFSVAFHCLTQTFTICEAQFMGHCVAYIIAFQLALQIGKMVHRQRRIRKNIHRKDKWGQIENFSSVSVAHRVQLRESVHRRKSSDPRRKSSVFRQQTALADLLAQSRMSFCFKPKVKERKYVPDVKDFEEDQHGNLKLATARRDTRNSSSDTNAFSPSSIMLVKLFGTPTSSAAASISSGGAGPFCRNMSQSSEEMKLDMSSQLSPPKDMTPSRSTDPFYVNQKSRVMDLAKKPKVKKKKPSPTKPLPEVEVKDDHLGNLLDIFTGSGSKSKLEAFPLTDINETNTSQPDVQNVHRLSLTEYAQQIPTHESSVPNKKENETRGEIGARRKLLQEKLQKSKQQDSESNVTEKKDLPSKRLSGMAVLKEPMGSPREASPKEGGLNQSERGRKVFGFFQKSSTRKSLGKRLSIGSQKSATAEKSTLNPGSPNILHSQMLRSSSTIKNERPIPSLPSPPHDTPSPTRHPRENSNSLQAPRPLLPTRMLSSRPSLLGTGMGSSRKLQPPGLKKQPSGLPPKMGSLRQHSFIKNLESPRRQISHSASVQMSPSPRSSSRKILHSASVRMTSPMGNSWKLRPSASGRMRPLGSASVSFSDASREISESFIMPPQKREVRQPASRTYSNTSFRTNPSSKFDVSRNTDSILNLDVSLGTAIDEQVPSPVSMPSKTKSSLQQQQQTFQLVATLEKDNPKIGVGAPTRRSAGKGQVKSAIHSTVSDSSASQDDITGLKTDSSAKFQSPKQFSLKAAVGPDKIASPPQLSLLAAQAPLLTKYDSKKEAALLK